MKNTIASVSAKRSKAPKRGKLNHIRIEPADNGHTVTEQYDPEDSDGGYYGDRKELRDMTVHPDMAAVAAHLMKMHGGKGEGPGKDGSKKHEKGETKAYEKKEQAEGDDD